MIRKYSAIMLIATVSLIWSSIDLCAQEARASVIFRPTNSALTGDRPLGADTAFDYLKRPPESSGLHVNGFGGDTAFRHPRRALVRGLVGLSIGAAVGALTGYELGRLDERNCVEECGISPRIGLDVGAILGGAIGFFVGLATTPREGSAEP